VGCIALVALASAARADTGMLPGGGAIQLARLFDHERGSAPLVVASSPTTYFNLAHCACSQPRAAPASFVERSFALELLLAPPGIARAADVWVGVGCDDPATRATSCHQIASASIADLSTLPTQPPGALPEISIYDLMVPEPPFLACSFRELVSSEWVMVDTAGGGTYDYIASKAIATDALAPPLPTSFAATPGPTTIDIAFVPPADTSDIAAYQAVCATTDGNPATTGPPPAPRYMTARRLCGESLDVPLVPSDIATGLPPAAVDAPLGVSIPQGVAELDPTFLCGDQPDPTASTIRLGPLPTGRTFVVVLLAIDHAGNAAATYFLSPLATAPTDGLWQDLHDRGGSAEGGLCLVAETYGDDHPITRALRGFRDDTLARTPLGRAAMAAYYATLGRLGAIVRRWWPLRVVAALALAPLVAFALLWHLLTLPGLVVLVLVARYAKRHAAWPSTRSPSTVPVGVGRQPRAMRSSSSSSAVGR
jgi:hypothetical protein